MTLDTITGAAAYVGNDRLDILASNLLARALYPELYAAPERPANFARFCFLDPRAETFYPSSDRAASDTVEILRAAAARDPHDRELTDLVGQLATQSDEFRTRWAAHDVRFHNSGAKHLHHPDVGEIHLNFNRLDLAADNGLTLFTYAAEPGSRSEDALRLLGSLAATADPARDPAAHRDRDARPRARRSSAQAEDRLRVACEVEVACFGVQPELVEAFERLAVEDHGVVGAEQDLVATAPGLHVVDEVAR
jgi:hypothetical protein